MILNAIERWAVGSPARVALQSWMVNWMLRARPLPPGSRVLEIGCGRGLGALMLHRRAQPGPYVAMDLDPRMLKTATRGLFRRLPRLPDRMLADAEAIPLADASVDAVFGFGFLHHVPVWRKALAEVARVLRPGGAYYLEEYYPATYANFLTKHLLAHPREDRFESSDLTRELPLAGFQTIGRAEHPKIGVVAVALR